MNDDYYNGFVKTVHNSGTGLTLIPLTMRVDYAEINETIELDYPSNYEIHTPYPNPFNSKSYVNVEIHEPCKLSLEVTNLIGQVVYRIPEREVYKGKTKLEIDASGMTPGVYFYSVKAGDSVITKKMIVE